MSEMDTNITLNSDIKIEKEYNPRKTITTETENRDNINFEKNKEIVEEKKTNEKKEITTYGIARDAVSYKWRVTETPIINLGEHLIYLLYSIKTDSKIKDIRDIDINVMCKEVENIDIFNFPWHLLPKNIFVSVFSFLKPETVFYIAGYYRVVTSMGKKELIQALYTFFVSDACKQEKQ